MYGRTLAVLRGSRASRALEAGCGDGAFTEMTLREGLASAIVGVDISQTALARTRARCRRFQDATFVRANLATDVPDGPFDLIVCGETLYYLGGRSVRACELLADRLADASQVVDAGGEACRDHACSGAGVPQPSASLRDRSENHEPSRPLRTWEMEVGADGAHCLPATRARHHAASSR